MADLKISALTASTTPLAGTEVLPIVQSSTTKQVSVANLTAGRAVTAASVTTTGEVKASGGLRVTGSYAANAANQVAFQNSAGVGAMYVNGATTGIGNLGTFVMWQQDSTGGNYLQTLGVDVTANVTVTSGNLVIGTSGKGIDFSVTSQATGMTSELLADYEKGTFTPTVIGTTTAGTATYAYAVGNYVKVGDAVNFQIIISWSAGSGTGNLNLGGLPFTAGSSYYSASLGRVDALALTALNIATAYVEGATTKITFAQTPAGGGAASQVPYDASVDALFISGTYFV